MACVGHSSTMMLIILLYLFFAVGHTLNTFNVEDGLYVNELQFNGRELNPPNWIFSFSDFYPSCMPLDNPTCPNGTCIPKFVKKEQRIYNYSCSIVDLDSVERIVTVIQNFTVGIYNSEISCKLPPTPSGKYLNGYTITLYGSWKQDRPGINFKDKCEVLPSYQDKPLSLQDIFSQTIVLNSTPMHSGINIFWLKDRSWINSYLFPKPPITYSSSDFPGHLIYVPKQKDIPKATGNSNTLAANLFTFPTATKILIYSHGNYEDLGASFEEMRELSNNLMINIIGYEYTGYGINSGTATETSVNNDIQDIFHYVVNTLKFETKNIILFGRSIGTGPTMFLASQKNISLGGVILISPFTSVVKLIEESISQVGGYLVADRFDNLMAVKKYFFPLFIIHGQDDDFIKPSQGLQLYNASVSKQKYIHLAPQMTHNDINWHMDIAVPISWFLSQLYPGRVPLSEFSCITTLSDSPKQRPTTMQNLFAASRGVSAAAMDKSFNLFSRKDNPVDISTTLATKEGLCEYITARLNSFISILQQKYNSTEPSLLEDKFDFVYNHFLTYEPFLNFYMEIVRLNVSLPPGASMLAKSAHALQSAPLGLLHAQLCVGGLVYSWDQKASGAAKETYFSHVSDNKHTVRIPLLIFHIRKRWARKIVRWLEYQDSAEISQLAVEIANEFLECYYDKIPDLNPLSMLVQEWNSKHYHAMTQNCQDFFYQAAKVLKLPHFANHTVYYSTALSEYITKIYSSATLFQPTLYGTTEEELITRWSSQTINSSADYALVSAKYFLRSTGYTSSELINTHAGVTRTLVATYKQDGNNSHFIVFVKK